MRVDDQDVGIATAGPARWRPQHRDQIAYLSHTQSQRAGIFLFEQVHLLDLASGEETVILDVADHGWTEAGHIDWNTSGTELVFAALEDDGRFIPHILEVGTGRLTRVPSQTQVIDTVFAPDDRIMGVDTAGMAEQFEPLAWIGRDGTVTPLTTSTGVNRDPVVSPDGRYVANIRASGPLARVFIGRWDLVITELAANREWIIGDGADGFGPPRWVDSHTLVAKHGRYNPAGIISGIPDPVLVEVTANEIDVLESIPPGAWDPDPVPTR